MLRDIYSVFLCTINFLKKNVSILIPFYILYLLFLYSTWGVYAISISFVLLLFLHSFVAIAIYEKESDLDVNIYKWRIIAKAFLNVVFLLLFGLVALIIGSLLLGVFYLFVPMYIIKILLFILIVNIVLSFMFGTFAVSFSQNTTPFEAIFIGLGSFYSNFLFYIFVILAGMLILMILVMLEYWVSVNFLFLLFNPVLTALQITSLAFAFLQKAKSKDNAISI